MKVVGSYARITGGVSEQDSYSRVEGQVTEQINFLTDPLTGLVRRRGSEVKAVSAISTTVNADTIEDDINNCCSNYRNFQFNIDKKEYLMGYRESEPKVLSTVLSPLFVERHSYVDLGNAEDLEVEHLSTVFSTNALQIAQGGFSAVTSIGKYILLAPKTKPVEFVSNPIPEGYRDLGVVWVRAGTYAKEYTLIFEYEGVEHTVKYKTNPSAFPVGLDTSKINWDSQKYSQIVNSLTAVYNGASTQYTGEAAAKIQPQYIAAQLARLICIAIGIGSENTADIGGGDTIKNDIVIPSAEGEIVTQWVTPSHTTEDIWSLGVVDGKEVKVPWGAPYNVSNVPVQQSEGYVLIGLAPEIKLQVSLDEGQNESMYSVQRTVTDLEYLTPMHYSGAVVQIKPSASKETIDGVYYRAYGALDDNVDGTFQAVYWEECSIDEVVPSFMFLLGTVYENTFYCAESPEQLEQLLAENGQVVEVPEFIPRGSGDDDSAPLPAFGGEIISYMGTFQDRLLIISGNVLNFSRSGDYFNFFRKSIQTVADDDPVEVYPTGSEGDKIYSAVSSGKNYLLFGNGYQYLLSGSVVLTPKNSNAVMKLSAFNNDNTVQPIASGNYCFYTQVGDFGTSLQEIPVAYLTDSPVTDNASAQLQHYIAGDVQCVVAGTNPNIVLIKTTGYNNGFYLMRYEDAPQQGGHVVNSWFKFEYNSAMGSPVAIRIHKGRIVVDFIRCKLSDTVTLLRATESFSLDTTVSDEPYIDSWCSWDNPKFELHKQWLREDSRVSDWTASFVYGKGEYWLMGTPYDESALPSEATESLGIIETNLQILPTTVDLYLGLNYPTFIEPTNPYVRNSEGVASRNGRLITGAIKVWCVNSGAIELVRYNQYGENPKVLRSKEGTLRFSDYYSSGNDPIGSLSISGYIGKDVSMYTYRINAIKWYPLSITKIDWSGQYFNNQGRV